MKVDGPGLGWTGRVMGTETDPACGTLVIFLQNSVFDTSHGTTVKFLPLAAAIL